MPDVTRDLFHCCALTAFVEQAIEQQGPPDLELTKRRAYRLYEQHLACVQMARSDRQ